MARSFLLLLILTLLSGCSTSSEMKVATDMANAKLVQEGAPYHWVSSAVEDGWVLKKEWDGKPCSSSAGPTFESDTLINIGKIEVGFDGEPKPTLLEVRCIPSVTLDELSEVWRVSRNDTNATYVVTFVTDPSGGTNIRIEGPWN